MEKMAAMHISLQETVMNMQSEMYACKERELTLQHKIEMQELEIKALRGELHAMKNMTTQMQDNRMPEIERKMLSLEAEKEILMKAHAEIKSRIEGKEDVIMTRWKDVKEHKRSNDKYVYTHKWMCLIFVNEYARVKE